MKTNTILPLFLFIFSITATAWSQTPPATVVKQDYTLNSGESDSYTATQSITLKPTTWIKAGSSFSAKVVPDAYINITLSSTENYILNRSYQRGMTGTGGIQLNGDVIESVTYFDGLGRAKQQVEVKASPDKKDLVTHIGYDDFGRQDKEWLPYKNTGTPGTYRGGDQETNTGNYYASRYPEDITGTAPNPFSQKGFEASPLNRVLQQAAPGHDWRLGGGREIKMDYQANTGTEVKRYKVDITVTTANTIKVYTPSLVLDGSYTAGTLYKTVTKDENWKPTQTYLKDHTTEEFKDKQGRVVLKRTYDNNAPHDTYYVYDDYGNLTYVLPPKAEPHSAKPTATELNELCYRYRYDERNRLVEKKVPGKGWEYIVYNTLNQPVLTQDTKLKNQGKWLFTKYDAFGRVAYTGTHNSTSGRTALQQAANNTTTYDQYVTKTGANTYAGTTVYYGNEAIPQGMAEILTINYYDNYTFDKAGLSVPTSVLGQAVDTRTKGLATGSKTRVLTTDQWITTLTAYDKKGRAV
ncbi:DUF6443 domain-containing protein, partial [Galbibacter sp. EGI 63066]|uniref:DUF6443 domain-containing protein n=1 Tax=Galbibacter sp. EGI 63066 TaxID=2993559 RepID=UPI0022487D71